MPTTPHRDPAEAPILVLLDRIETLEVWPLTLADSYEDPRCGCGGDTACDWDDLRTLEHAYASRMRQPVAA